MYLLAKVKKKVYGHNAQVYEIKKDGHYQKLFLVATFKGFPKFQMLKKAIGNFAKSGTTIFYTK